MNWWEDPKYADIVARQAARPQKQCLTYGCLERAIPGRSRCRKHGSGWDAKPKWRDDAYADPEYKRLRAELLATKPLCSYPGCPRIANTLDHIIPVSRGGTNVRENLRPMCLTHNMNLGRDLGNQAKRRRKP